MFWRMAMGLWLVLGAWCSHAHGLPLNADSLQKQWRQTLRLPGAKVAMAIQQHASDIRQLPFEAKLQARMLALGLASAGPKEERRIFNLLALYLETETLRYINIDSLKQSLVQFITEATLAETYHLAAEAGFRLSVLAEQFQDYANSAYFGLKGRDLLLKGGNPSNAQLYAVATRLASISFNTAQYRECVRYGLEALANEDKAAPVADLRNTIGLGYRGLGIFDSAMYWFEAALALAQNAGSNPTIGMVEGNMAQVYFARGQLNSAFPLLQSDVQKSLAAHDVPNAMNSLQFMARIQALQGKPTDALASLHTCLANLPLIPNMRYRQNIMEAAGLVYHLAGNHDSARYAITQQIIYRDSMQARINSNRMGAVAVQLNYENSLQQLQKITLEKKLAIERRNLLVVILLLLGVTAWLITNRERMKLKHRQQAMLHQKQVAEREVAAANEQLSLLTKNLMAKTEMVETLQQELSQTQISQTNSASLEELKRQVILTEADWVQYRELFEKVHPGFLLRVRQLAPDISQAEMRMAVLMRLQFDNKQMAGILGISVESVSKAKRRLRQRLGIPPDIAPENFIQTISPHFSVNVPPA